MVRAYYISGPNQNRELSIDEVEILTGALLCKVVLDNLPQDDDNLTLEDIKKQTGYNSDQVLHFSSKAMAEDEYQASITEFRREHMHLEHEIRCVIEGTASFDVRDLKDEWIQILLVRGDLLILPAGVYHRLSLCDERPEVKVVRLFKHRRNWRSFHRAVVDQVNFRSR